MLVFRSNERHGLLDVEPQNCELRVFARRYDECDEFSGFYLHAQAVDLEHDCSDCWYDFIGFSSDREVFEVLGVEPPSCAKHDGGTWVFETAADALHWARRFAEEGLCVEYVPTEAEQFVKCFFDAEDVCNGSELYPALILASSEGTVEENQDWENGRSVWTFADGSEIVMQGSEVETR